MLCLCKFYHVTHSHHRRCHQSRKADDGRMFFNSRLNNAFCRYIFAEINHSVTIILQQHHKIFADVMNIAFHRRHNDGGFFLLIILDQHWLQIINRLLHGFRTGNQLGQVIFLLLKQNAYLLDSGDQMFLDHIIRHNTGIQTFFYKVNNTALATLHHSLKDFLSRSQNHCCCRRAFSALLFFDCVHAVDISDICIRMIHQQIRCKSSVHQKVLGRICNGHGKASANSHGQKGCINIGAFWQAKGNIRQTADGCQFKLIMTIRNRIQCFNGCIFVGTNGCHQAIHHNVLFMEAQLQCTIHNCMNNLNLFIYILRQPLIRQRQQNKHSTVFSRNRKQMFKLFLLKGNRIDQRTPRINTQCRFNNIYMT